MNKSNSNNTSCPSNNNKLERKVIEKTRRDHMKGLCIKLTSIIPPHHFKPSKDILSLLDQLDQAASYITQLKEKIEKLQKVKAIAEGKQCGNCSKFVRESTTLPLFELKDFGSTLEVVFISGLEKKIMVHEVIRVLQDEGAEVVNLSVSTLGEVVYHLIHAQVLSSRIGVKISSVYQRLNNLIC